MLCVCKMDACFKFRALKLNAHSITQHKGSLNQRITHFYYIYCQILF